MQIHRSFPLLVIAIVIAAIVVTAAWILDSSRRSSQRTETSLATANAVEATPSQIETAPQERAPAAATAPEPEQSAASIASSALVTGRVVESDGRSISGATIELVSLAESWLRSIDSARDYGSIAWEATTQSDEHGKFALRDVPLSGLKCMLRASATGHATSAEKRFDLRAPTCDVGDILLAIGSSIVGRTVDASQRPIANAQVLVSRSAPGPMVRSDPGTAATRSDSAGVFRIDHVAAGMVRLCAQTDELRSEWSAPWIVPDAEALRDVVLVLEPGVTIHGHVVDYTSGAPLRAKVVLRPNDGDRTLSGESGADGEFRIRGAKWGSSYAYGANALDHYLNDGGNVFTLPESSTAIEDLTIRVKARSEVVDFVAVDGATGAVVPGAELVWALGDAIERMTEWNPRRFDAIAAAQRAGSDGRNRVEKRPNAAMFAIVRAAGYAPQSLNVHYLSSPGARVELTKGASLRARITSDGRPAAGAAVELSQGVNLRQRRARNGNDLANELRPVLIASRSDAEGVVTFDCLPPGDYGLMARTNDRGTAMIDVREIAPRESRNVAIDLPQSASLHGRVLVPGSSSQFPVVFVLDEHNFARKAECDEQARYEFAALPPGKYRVLTARSGDAEDSIECEDAGVRQIELVSGQSAELDLERRPIVHVRGTVSVNGSPRPDLRVELRRSDSGDVSCGSLVAYTDARGEYELSGPSDLSGTISVSVGFEPGPPFHIAEIEKLTLGDARSPYDIDVRCGEVEFETVLQSTLTPARWVNVTLRPDASHGGVPGFSTRSMWDLRVAGSGRLHAATLPIGNYRVSAIGPDGLKAGDTPLTVDSPGPVEFRIELGH